MCPVLQGGCDIHSRDSTLNPLLRLAAGCGSLDAVAKLVDATLRIQLPFIVCSPYIEMAFLFSLLFMLLTWETIAKSRQGLGLKYSFFCVHH